MTRFAGKAVVVTGAGSGIGAAIARRFVDEGASVLVTDIVREPAEDLAAELQRGGGRAVALSGDVSDEAAVREAVDAAVAQFGGLDVMVNNAGVGEKPTPITEKGAEEWQRIVGINLTGVFHGVKHAARAMKAAGRGGVIINMASILGTVGLKGAPAYTAAKHGVLGLTKAAALELAGDRIRVVAVSPAFIRTPLITDVEDAVLPLHPIGRLGTVDEVAALTLFLASDEAAFITGTQHLVDGGYTAQ